MGRSYKFESQSQLDMSGGVLNVEEEILSREIKGRGSQKIESMVKINRNGQNEG